MRGEFADHILAGLLVLAGGAIAAGQRARLYDSTVMKVLGATRAEIALIYAIEYGLLGLATGLIAIAAGTVAAEAVTERVFAVAFDFDAGAVLTTVLGGEDRHPGFWNRRRLVGTVSLFGRHLRHP